jgi:hypothetical protein
VLPSCANRQKELADLPFARCIIRTVDDARH